MAGRPEAFSQEIADQICQRLANGESLRTICADEALPAQSSVFRWLAKDAHEEFREQYARAREAQAEALFDEMLDIADDGSNDWMERKNADGGNIGWVENGEAMRRSTLRVDTRKWIVSRLLPKKYGDKVVVGGDPANPIKSDVTHHGAVTVSASAAFVAAALGNGTPPAPREPREG